MQLDTTKKVWKMRDEIIFHKTRIFGVKEALLLSYSQQGFSDNVIMIYRIIHYCTHEHEQSYKCIPRRH